MKLLFVSIPTYRHPLSGAHARWQKARRVGEDAIHQMMTGMSPTVGRKSMCRGLWALASEAMARAHDVRWCDYSEPYSATLGADLAWADQLWLYAMTPTIGRCLMIAEDAKRANPDIKVLIGGPHANTAYIEILAGNLQVDAAAISPQPAELVMQDLDNSLAFPGIAVRRNGKIEVADPQPYGEYREVVRPEVLSSPLQDYYINVSGSMGCPGRCSFCANGSRPFALRHSVDVRNELASYDEMLPTGTVVHLYDSSLTLPRDRCLEICQFIATDIRSTHYSCDIEGGTLDDTLLASLSHARLHQISIGFETSDSTVLRTLGKRASFSDCVDTAQRVRQFMPYTTVKAYWLFGLPGSTASTLNADLDAIRYLLDEEIVDIVSPKLFIPYPGSDFHRLPAEYGLVISSANYDDYDRHHLPPVSFPESVGELALSQAVIDAEKILATAYSRRLGKSVEELLNSDLKAYRYSGPLYVA